MINEIREPYMAEMHKNITAVEDLITACYLAGKDVYKHVLLETPEYITKLLETILNDLRDAQKPEPEPEHDIFESDCGEVFDESKKPCENKACKTDTCTAKENPEWHTTCTTKKHPKVKVHELTEDEIDALVTEWADEFIKTIFPKNCKLK